MRPRAARLVWRLAGKIDDAAVYADRLGDWLEELADDLRADTGLRYRQTFTPIAPAPGVRPLDELDRLRRPDMYGPGYGVPGPAAIADLEASAVDWQAGTPSDELAAHAARAVPVVEGTGWPRPPDFAVAGEPPREEPLR